MWVAPFTLRYSLVAVVVATGLMVSPTLEAPRSWFLLALTLTAIGGGTHFLVRSHPGYRFYVRKPATFLYWIAPMALAFGGALFTIQLLGGPLTLLGMGITSLGVILVLYCQYVLAEPGNSQAAFARLISNLSVYLSAFLLFVAFQSSEVGLLHSGIILGGLSGLLSLELFQEVADRPWREALYALVVALLIAEVSWALHYLPLGKVITGLALLLAFYLLAGLIHHHLLDRLSPWVALEFVAVTVVGLGFLYGFQVLGG